MRSHIALPSLVVVAMGSAGCLIERQNLQGPVEDDASLDGVDAAGLDAWRPDAFTATDAFNPNDAFTALDANTPPDAFVAPDVLTPPDAFIAPDTGCNGRDDDRDGLSDPCDPWPCGAMPTIAARVSGDHITMSAVRINGGGNTLVTRGGGSVGVNMHFAITEVDRMVCDCIQQIEVGSVDGQFETCIYDSNPPSSGGSGNEFVDFAMPRVTTPTRVDLRYALGLQRDCAADWSSTPPATQTFGVVCVVP